MVCVVATSARTASAVLREGISSVRDAGRRGSHRRDRLRPPSPDRRSHTGEGAATALSPLTTHGSSTHRLPAHAVLPWPRSCGEAPSPHFPAVATATGVLCARRRCRLPGIGTFSGAGNNLSWSLSSESGQSPALVKGKSSRTPHCGCPGRAKLVNLADNGEQEAARWATSNVVQ